jgi:hypothetical protein
LIATTKREFGKPFTAVAHVILSPVYIRLCRSQAPTLEC